MIGNSNERDRQQNVYEQHDAPITRVLWRDCLASLIRALHLVAETVALLLGMHFMLLLHLINFLNDPEHQEEEHGQDTTEQAEGEQQQRPLHRPLDDNPHQAINGVRFRPRLVRRGIETRPRSASTLHLPALGPRPLHGRTGSSRRSKRLRAFVRQLKRVRHAASDWLTAWFCTMADQVEAMDGPLGAWLYDKRHGHTAIDVKLARRLPSELVNYILLLAATPSDDDDGTPAIPHRIARLSRAHHRMIVPRLYGHVHLADPIAFRRFRMTMAVHNPALGHHLRSLAIASSRFDSDGYLPDQVAEYVTLGVGIEQILLAAPNLHHLFLDLFSLAALHNGTAARLEKGALPISLTTEFSMPQYLTLPTFVHLRHVELTVFGLDTKAVEWFRQVLPRLESLTLRWVTRQHRQGRAAIVGSDDATRGGWHDANDLDLDQEERMAWREGGTRREDFGLFVEALELVRAWPYNANGAADGQQLQAVTVLAWPKAYRELCRHFGTSALLSSDDVGQETKQTWDHSLSDSIHSVRDQDDSIATSSTFFTSLDPFFATEGTTPASEQPPPLAPLRILQDRSHLLGPRRGPLEAWLEAHQRGQW